MTAVASCLADCLASAGARPATEGDAAFFALLYAALRSDLLGDGSADPVFAAGLVAMQQRLQAADYRRRYPAAATFLLTWAGQPAGRLVLDADDERLRLVDIGLLPAMRGHGLGTAIIAALRGWASARGLPLTLSVHRSNPRAHALYTRLGFACSGADAHAKHLFISTEKL